MRSRLLVLVTGTALIAGCMSGAARVETEAPVLDGTRVLTVNAAIAFGQGALWTATPDMLVRIDPTTGASDPPMSIAAEGSIIAIAVGANDIWLAVYRGSLMFPDEGAVLRVDSTAQRVIASIPVLRAPAGCGPGGLTIGEGAVWVAHCRDAMVSRIDPVTNQVTDKIRVGKNPGAIAVGEGSVWVANRYGTVSRIDPGSRQVVATIAVGSWTHGIAVGEGLVWVVRAARFGLKGTVLRIDPKTNRLVGEPISVGSSAWDVVIGEGALWVSNQNDDSVSRIDPATGRVTSFFGMACPAGLAVGGAALWVGHSSSAGPVLFPFGTFKTCSIGVTRHPL